MYIPSTEVWAAVGTVLVAAVVFAFSTQRSLGKMLTRKEHKEICDQKNEAISQGLNRIETNLTNHMQETRENSERVNQSLHTIGLQVKVIETKMRMQENERG